MERSVKRFSARYLFLRLFSLNSLPYLISRPVFPTFSFFFSSLRSSLLHARLDVESERRLKGLFFFFLFSLNSPSLGFTLSIFPSSSTYGMKRRDERFQPLPRWYWNNNNLGYCMSVLLKFYSKVTNSRDINIAYTNRDRRNSDRREIVSRPVRTEERRWERSEGGTDYVELDKVRWNATRYIAFSAWER